MKSMDLAMALAITDGNSELRIGDDNVVPVHVDEISTDGRNAETTIKCTVRSSYPMSYIGGRANGKTTYAEWVRRRLDIESRRLAPSTKMPKIVKVIFNKPATIVFWSDETKTVVKAQKREKFDPEKGLAMAIAKKALGNEGNYYNEFTKHIEK